MLRIAARSRDLGGFTVGRVLPHHQRRLVGPFIFFDHLGPAIFPPGHGMDVRPHPHIGLSTVTYLFEGAITHRDSLGTMLDIGPGAVNWMTAGHGISHSERTPAALRASGHAIHGIQTWVALPVPHEGDTPAFVHHPAQTIPQVAIGRGTARVIAGTMWGAVSPVRFPHPIIYAELRLEPGATVPMERLWGERALYLISGDAALDGERLAEREMVVIDDDAEPVLEALGPVHAMICGGAPLDGERHIWWNLVASDPAIIEQAKADWAAAPVGGRFGTVPGESEYIPLPD